MTDREKLIELLLLKPCRAFNDEDYEDDCDDCAYGESWNCHEERLADYLIANGVTVQGNAPNACQHESNAFNALTNTNNALTNGVTVQRWIPAEERLPKKYEPVLAAFGYVIVNMAMYVGNRDWETPSGMLSGVVTHWMPLPEPPKED